MTCHVTGAGVEYDPKQQATAEFIDNMLPGLRKEGISAHKNWHVF